MTEPAQPMFAVTSSGRLAGDAAVAPPTHLLVCGQPVKGAGEVFPVVDRLTGTPIATLRLASPAQARAAVVALGAAPGLPLAPGLSALALDVAATLVEQRAQRFIETMQAERGLTLVEAARDLNNALQALRLAAVRARHLAPDALFPNCVLLSPVARAPLPPAMADRRIFLLMPGESLHDVAVGIAMLVSAGKAMILKPSLEAPLSAALLAEALLDAGIDAARTTLLHGDSAVADTLLDDERVALLSYWLY